MAVLSKEMIEVALCRGKGPWPWITPEDATKDEFNRAAAAAQEICSQCPAQKECRVAGLREPRGTWGGVTYRERGY